MRQGREHGAAQTGGERGGSSEPLGPGKTTLTGAMSGLGVQRKPAVGSGGAAPSGPGKATLTGAMTGPAVQRGAQPAGAADQPRTRDVSRDVSAEAYGGAHDGGAHDVGELGGDAHDAGELGGGAHDGGGAFGGGAFGSGDQHPDTLIPDGPAPGGGAHVAATVVGSAADNELAGDGAFTPALLADLAANPHLSIDEVLQRVASAAVAQSPYSSGLQHPTILQMGRMPRGGTAPGARGGKKRAVLVANEDYAHQPELFTPLSEAQDMKTELATRGYESGVHHNKTAADMAALWNGLVGAANPGDDLVAFYGGHGEPAGLAGIHHGEPPLPPDLFRNAQVSGVVSAATDKGAHIRFVMDSCYSGSAVDKVREERHNELAAATGAGSVGDELRIATMTGLRHAKQRLLGLRSAQRAISQLRAPTRHVRLTRDVSASTWLSAADQTWADCAPLIEMAHMIARRADAPPPADPTDLAARLNYLDDLWNALQQPLEDALGKSAEARKVP